MRIIKYSDIKTDREKYLNTVAGEMYNIESGQLRFIDGQLVEDFKPGAGYPVYKSANVSYSMRMSSGAIIVPNFIDVEILQSDLIERIKSITEKAELADNIPLGKHMNTVAHTVGMNQHTNLQVMSELAITNPYGRVVPNIKRQFILGPQTSMGKKQVRFYWVIMLAEEALSIKYTTDMAEEMLRDRVGSIYVDAMDLLTLKHNDIVFDFTPEYYRSWKNIKLLDAILAPYGPPLMSSFRRGFRAGEMRNLSCTVFRADYNKLKIIKFGPDDPADVRPNNSIQIIRDGNDRCFGCQNLLIGDNYVLYGKKVKKTMAVINANGEIEMPQELLDTFGVPICAFCIHSRTSETSIEKRYSLILRVTFPRSYEKMVLEIPNHARRRLYMAALTEGVLPEIIEGDSVNSHLKVGSKWRAYYNLNRYITNHRESKYNIAIIK